MEAIVFNTYMKRWYEGNEAAEGFAVGLETDNAEQAVKREGDKLIHSDMTAGRSIAIGGRRLLDGRLHVYIVRGNGSEGHGPWAVWL